MVFDHLVFAATSLAQNAFANVRLAADWGYGVPWLVQVLTTAIILATGFFVYVALSTKHAALQGENSLKYKLNKYHAERYWAIFVAGMLVWLWTLGLPWMPPAAYSEAMSDPSHVHTVYVTAGQWFWMLEDGGYGTGPTWSQQTPAAEAKPAHAGASAFEQATGPNGAAKQVHVKVNETVKFVARSIDVNHGFSVLASNKSMDSPLMQMQVVPGFDNVAYYTFTKPGTYTIRCLEYCGWNHPFMVSQVTIYAS
ncbi:MAG: hypothetical protein ABI361_10430 [Nitrososphaera sp.]|jgi:cytochrome c oxidase subunit 2